MRLMSFRRADGTTSWGLVEGEEVVDCGAARAKPSRGARERKDRRSRLGRAAPSRSIAITFLPPIPDPEKIICVGLNYLTHIREGGRDVPKQPTIFTRFANTQVGHLQALIRPAAVGDARFRRRDGGGDRQSGAAM